MLEEYASTSHGKVKVELYDPEPFSDTEDHAVAYGLQGVPVDNAGNQVYFGLAGNNLEDDERTIPFFQAEREKLPFDRQDDLRSTIRQAHGGGVCRAADRRRPAMSDGRRRTGAEQVTFSGVDFGWQTNTVKSVALDALVIDPDIQVLLVAGRSISGITALCDRPVRLCATANSWSWWTRGRARRSPLHRHAAHRYVIGSEEVVRRLGHR